MAAEHWAWLGAGILSLMSLAILIGNFADRVAKTRKAIKAPYEELKAEVIAMKEWRADLEEEGSMKDWRKSVNKRLSDAEGSAETFKDSYHVMFQAMLALLDHGIDGNNISQMEDAKKAVQSYLIDK